MFIMSEHPQSIIDYRDPDWVADKLGLDKQTVYKYLQEGTLPGLQLGRKWLISERALVAHLDEEQRRQTAARRANAEQAQGDVMAALQDDVHTIGVLAELAARRLYHNYIGQEHLVIAFAEATKSTAARALATLGAGPARLRGAVDMAISPGRAQDATAIGEIGLTPRARRALDLAGVAAKEAGAAPNSGHLLLGILREGTGVGAAVLRALGVDEAKAVKAIEGLAPAPSDASEPMETNVESES
jgi:excisionase family DNA binding protein